MTTGLRVKLQPPRQFYRVHRITDIINFMSRLYGKHFRVLLIIDDLDRCQPKRIMGVLEAVSLLLEPKDDETRSPFISVLAIDPRVVLGAIERHFDPDMRRDFTQANVNGYEYLKKIIHMPFCLPGPTCKEKQDYIDILLKKDNEPQLKEQGREMEIPRPEDVPPPLEGEGDAVGDEEDVEIGGDVANMPMVPHDIGDERPLDNEIFKAGELMQYVKDQLKDQQLLHFVHGNPRTLKRICNIILLAISVFRDNQMNRPRALKLTLVVLMIEQWPFRTSFLRQYYMNKKQKAVDRNPVWKRIGDLDIKHIPAETPKDIKHLENTPLIDVWEHECAKLSQVARWQKFLSFDFDPELFYAFISTYRLRVKHLEEYIPFAVNHDTNIESIVEQGLAELDLKSLCENQPEILAPAQNGEAAGERAAQPAGYGDFSEQ